MRDYQTFKTLFLSRTQVYRFFAKRKRNHNSVSNAKVLSNLAFASATIQIAIQNRHRAECRNLKHYPTWRKVVGVFGLESLDELLITPSKFLIHV